MSFSRAEAGKREKGKRQGKAESGTREKGKQKTNGKVTTRDVGVMRHVPGCNWKKNVFLLAERFLLGMRLVAGISLCLAGEALDLDGGVVQVEFVACDLGDALQDLVFVCLSRHDHVRRHCVF